MRLLDLFSGAGGAAMGYHRAGFEVVGVDINPQPRYPFEFHQADAMSILRGMEGWPSFNGEMWRPGYFDAIHASPPCQAFTQMSARWRGKGTAADEHLDLLTPTLERLRQMDKPWVVENVPGARRLMRNPLILHGGQFGLGVHRPRLFESNVMLLNFTARATRSPLGVYGKPDGRTTYRYRNNGNLKGKSLIRAWKSLEEGSAAMGIDWMDVAGLREAIPPAYTEFIGEQLMAALTTAVAS
ncbi:MAG TPA: DNA cytosine methyltransferase [Actinomycetota bacterium]|nr:DNA cytosine methyltransferase [Actinomycetota bacterium]